MANFIVIEGLDGTGKSTQIKLLQKHLEKLGNKVFATAEPTNLPTGKLLRQILSGEVEASPWASASMFLADRIQHNICKGGIKEHLAGGETVICDRYYYSTFAYQGFETNLHWCIQKHQECKEVTVPDLVLFLTMPVEKCLERIRANRPVSAIEIYENEESLSKISAQFDKVFDLIKHRENIVYIDASGTVEEVANSIANVVDEFLTKKRLMAADNLFAATREYCSCCKVAGYCDGEDCYLCGVQDILSYLHNIEHISKPEVSADESADYVLSQLKIPDGFSVEITQQVDKNRLDCVWYGGEVAKVHYKGFTFTVEAIGDVKAYLFDEHDKEIARVKDKGNGGHFYDEMRQFIANDKELKELSDGCRLVYDDANWWECFATTPDGKFHDMQDVVDADDLVGAIQTVIDTADEIIGWLTEDRNED